MGILNVLFLKLILSIVLATNHYNFNILKEIAKNKKLEIMNIKNFLWPIKKFQKYFMAHQYMLIIFHNPFKNPPTPFPTYLMYGP